MIALLNHADEEGHALEIVGFFKKLRDLYGKPRYRGGGCHRV